MAGGTTEQERPLHILTVNINGLKTNGDTLLKEPKLKSEVDVIFLQETHVKDRDAWKDYEEDWEIYPTCYDPRIPGCFNFKKKKVTKGAAILLNKKRSFRENEGIIDDLGRYVIVNCWISGTLCTFVSVYHHKKQRGLLKELSKKIKPLYTDILVVGGDFNTALHEVKDRTSPFNNPVHNRIREELLPFLGKHDLLDAWREKHPNKRKYTYVKGLWETSRLDYFFIDAEKWELVKDCRINEDIISDHRSVSLFLDLKDQIRKLKIFSCAVHDLPKDEHLAELCPDIILLTKGKAEDVDYITKLKEGEKIWNVLWSRHSNAAILVAEGQRGIQILFTVYHEDYVILHCIVLGMRHTFVSVCHPTEENLQDMVKEIMPSYSGRKVIGGDFSTSEQRIIEFMKTNEFNIPEGGSTQSRYLIHAQVGRAYETEEKISDRPYSSLILHLPEMNPEGVDNIIQSLGKLKIHH